MRTKLFYFVMILALVFSFVGAPQTANAAGYGTVFLTSITYMNVGSGTATINIDFYEEGATSVTTSYSVATLAQNAAASLGIGTVFTGSFKGSAVMASDQKLVATMVQVPQGATTVKNRPLSNGFSGGSSPILIGTALKNKFSTNSIVSVQNAGASATTVTLEFIPSTDGTPYAPTFSLNPGAAKYFDLGTLAEIGSIFNGSMRASANQPLVASVLELRTNGDAVYAFEGISGGATTLYMPSALCQFGPSITTTAYAIQNTSASLSTKVTVTFSGTYTDPVTKVVTPITRTTDAVTVAAGGKTSVGGCGDTNNVLPATFLGSAKINSISVDGGPTPAQNLIAIGKVAGTGAFATAFEAAMSGYDKLALPYVRYSNQFFAYTNSRPVQRTNIAVQNIGAGTINANNITVKFVGPNGTVMGTYTYASDLAVGAKFSVNPAMVGLPEFGYEADPVTGLPKSYGGGAIIEAPAGSQLAAIARIETSTSAGNVAEDYTGMLGK